MTCNYLLSSISYNDIRSKVFFFAILFWMRLMWMGICMSMRMMGMGMVGMCMGMRMMGMCMGMWMGFAFMFTRFWIWMGMGMWMGFAFGFRPRFWMAFVKFLFTGFWFPMAVLFSVMMMRPTREYFSFSSYRTIGCINVNTINSKHT